MKLNINPILFEQIRRQSLNESDDKMEMVKGVFDLLTSPDPQNAELAKNYISQDYFQKYMPYLNKIGRNIFGEMEELTGMNWLELIQQTQLDLSGKGLKTLPESIGNLINLERIYLQNNTLAELPKSIGNLINLQILDLSWNGLIHIPNTIGNLDKLKLLDLQANNLTTIPNSFGNLKNLKELDLRHNMIPESEEGRIKSLLPNFDIWF